MGRLSNHDNKHRNVQTTLDPEFNLATAQKALEESGTVESVDILGGYVSGSTSYGMALGTDAALNIEATSHTVSVSDIDLFVIANGDRSENPDYVSDVYDAVNRFNSENPSKPEVNVGVVNEQKVRGCLTQAGKDFVEKGRSDEYVKIDTPEGEDNLRYHEFVESLMDRVPLMGIENSKIERDIRAGEHLVSKTGPEDSKVSSYMEGVCEEKAQELKENERLGRELRETNKVSELLESGSGMKYRTSLAEVLRNQISQLEIPKIVEGTFGDLQVDLDYPVSAEEYVFDKASSHEHVDIQQSDSSREFKLGNVHFSDSDLDYEELLEDAVKGKLGRMISDGSVRQNPKCMEIDEVFRCLYADVTGFGS